jgi:acetyl esterase/lipase
VSANGRIDPEIVAAMVADGMPPDVPGPPPTLELLETMRAQPPRVPFDPEPPPGVRREELTAPGAAGAPDVPVRVYRREARAAAAVPAILWLHGGGYVLGSHDLDQPFLDTLVAETPYPGGLDDCFAALVFLYEHAAELGVDASRLAVGGFSAGAGLAAACALRARDEGVPLVHQHLVYPMLDDRQTTVSSRWDGLAVWSREMNAFAWRCYLGDLYGGDGVPAYAAAARAGDLAGLAPAYLHVGSLDGFLHENLDYAGRLLAAGVPTELHVFPHAPHGFEHVAPEAALSRRANALSEAALARVLGV